MWDMSNPFPVRGSWLMTEPIVKQLMTVTRTTVALLFAAALGDETAAPIYEISFQGHLN